LNAVICEVCLVHLVYLVCLVYLVDLVHLVSFVQPNKQDKPNKPNEQDGLAAFFSILQLKKEFDADRSQMNIGIICPIDGGVKIPGNPPRFIKPFLKRHIHANRLRP
jgi:hypothetical protein